MFKTVFWIATSSTKVCSFVNRRSYKSFAPFLFEFIFSIPLPQLKDRGLTMIASFPWINFRKSLTSFL